MRLVAEGVEKAWGDRLVLRGIDLVVEAGERVGLVGANGCGKSTLLAILGGSESADSGRVRVDGAIGFLGQEPKLPERTVGDAARAALRWHHELVADWEAAMESGDEVRVGELQSRLDRVGWDLSHQVAAVLTRLRAPAQDAEIARLSGGELRRVALARALLAAPEVLLLDEPTNHLDAETVDWLEGWLKSFGGVVVLVTHDRYLLESVATRIVEIEVGQAVGYDGSYSDYLIGRAERHSRLAKADDTRLMMIRREAEWASRSPAAQTRKQKARLSRLDELENQEGYVRPEAFSFELRCGVKMGRTLIDARGLKKSFGGRRLFNGLDLDVGPGERLGIVGPNGAGKSTLLSMIQGTQTPDAGTITRSPRLKVSVLDQARTGLNEKDTISEAAGGGNDTVVVGDTPVHVAGFLKRFLFGREMLDQRVAGLSGGERARLLLAKLMLQGSQLLLLDEPTNDLDLTTLAVLEEALLGFDGAAIIVTHDRAFLDRVCTGVLAFYGDGRVVKFASRQQWMAALAAETRAAELAAIEAEAEASRRLAARVPEVAKQGGPRLSHREKQELLALPARLEAMDTEKGALEAALANPATWKGGEGAELSRKLAELTATIEKAWARWEELEGRK